MDINNKNELADANFHYTECNMNKSYQSIIWILTIRMSYKHTRVWIQDMCKKSAVLTKSIGRQGSRSPDFGAEIRPHSQCQKVCFFPNSRQKIPNLKKKKKKKNCFFFVFFLFSIFISYNTNTEHIVTYLQY